MWVKTGTGLGSVVYFCAISTLEAPFFVYQKSLLAAQYFSVYMTDKFPLATQIPPFVSLGATQGVLKVSSKCG
jgi:hypothetical protein